MAEPVSPGRIVVGVDGSEPSLRALGWAVRQAALTGAVIDAVTAWQLPAAAGWDVESVPPDLDLEADAHALQREAFDTVFGPDRPTELRPRVVEGSPARVLLDAARGADVLVLGSRGRGGFAGALLGSVGQHCIQHATCPVLIIPAHPA